MRMFHGLRDAKVLSEWLPSESWQRAASRALHFLNYLVITYLSSYLEAHQLTDNWTRLALLVRTCTALDTSVANTVIPRIVATEPFMYDHRMFASFHREANLTHRASIVRFHARKFPCGFGLEQLRIDVCCTSLTSSFAVCRIILLHCKWQPTG